MATGELCTIPVTISWLRPPVSQQGSAVSEFSTVSNGGMKRFAEGKSFIVTTVEDNVQFVQDNQTLGDTLTFALSVLESGDYTAFCQLPKEGTVDFRLAIQWNDGVAIQSLKPSVIESANVASLRFDVGVATDPCSVHPKMSGERVDGTTFGQEMENKRALLPKSRSRRPAEGQPAEGGC